MRSDLSRTELSGSIPDLGNLTALTSLAMTGIFLTGSIPTSLSSLTALTSLDLTMNSLTGAIPDGIGDLTSLVQLRMSDNVDLNGTIPSSFGSMTSLTSVEIAGCKLSGTIPESIRNLTALTLLDLSGNQLIGTIPDAFDGLTQLNSLYLRYNNLSGSLPASLFTLPAITVIDFRFNSLSGSIPTEIGDLSALNLLSLNSNQLGGTLPQSIGGLTELWAVDLSDNMLSGTIPDAVGGLTNMIHMRLDFNQFTGTIPSSLANLPTLFEFSAGNNMLTGTIPASLAACTMLTYLVLGQNQLTGSIPESFGNLTSLFFLDLHSNELVGSIPSSLGNIWGLNTLALHDNMLSGSISDEMVAKLSLLNYLFLDHNRLTGGIPESIGGQMMDVMELYLSDNLLSGTIPSNLGDLTSLSALDLSSNLLSGTLPDSFDALINLRKYDGVTAQLTTLRLDSNQLSGELPAWLGEYSGRILGLSNNLFNGSMPSGLLSYPFTTGYVPGPFNCEDCTYLSGLKSGVAIEGAYWVNPPTVTSVPGAFLTACAAGTYRSGADTTVHGTVHIPAPICSACELGTVAPLPGAIFCSPCPENQYAAGDSINCATCPANSVSPAGSQSASNCTCVYGYVSGGSAGAANSAAACSLCMAGTYYNGATQTCDVCALGTHASSAGAAACTPNTPGYYSSADRATEIACAAGTFLNGSSLSCASCPPGSFTNLPGQTSCQVNPPGMVSKPQTTFASNLSIAGVSAASFGATQNATLTASIASTLSVAASSVLIQSVADVAARRRLAAVSLHAAFTCTVGSTAAAAAVAQSFNNTAGFAHALVAALSAAGDPVLGAVSASSIAVAPPSITAVYVASEPCPAGTSLNGLTQNCDACAFGTVAPSHSSTACTACPPRTAWVNASVACQACPDNAVTSPNSPAQCACGVGYYDALFGASLTAPACVACPLGGVCVSGFLAADQDFWRENTTSDQLYKCRVGNCLAEVVVGPLTIAPASGNVSAAHRRLLGVPLANASTAPTNCVPGNTGPLCSVCVVGYALQSGACSPCNPADAWDSWSPRNQAGLLVGCVIVGMVFLALAFLQPAWPRLERAADATKKRLLAAARRVADAVSAVLSYGARKHAPTATPAAPETSTEVDHAAGDAAAPDSERAQSERLHRHSRRLSLLAVSDSLAANAAFEDAANTKQQMISGRLHHHHQHSQRLELASVSRSLVADAAFAVGNAVSLIAQTGDATGEVLEGLRSNTSRRLSAVERQTELLDRLGDLADELKAFGKILVKCVHAPTREQPRSGVQCSAPGRATRLAPVLLARAFFPLTPTILHPRPSQLLPGHLDAA